MKSAKEIKALRAMLVEGIKNGTAHGRTSAVEALQDQLDRLDKKYAR
jgi:hypothetical protein